MGVLDDLGIPDWARDALGAVGDTAQQIVTGQVAQRLGTGIANFFTPSPNGPQLKNPALSPTQGGPLFPSTGDASPDPFAILGESRNYATIRAKMKDQLGFAPRRKTVFFMLRRMGADFTAGALGLDQNDILWLYTHRRTGSRRHYLQTYLKWIRRADSAKRALAPFARKVNAGRGSTGSHRRRRPAPPAVRIVKVPAR